MGSDDEIVSGTCLWKEFLDQRICKESAHALTGAVPKFVDKNGQQHCGTSKPKRNGPVAKIGLTKDTAATRGRYLPPECTADELP